MMTYRSNSNLFLSRLLLIVIFALSNSLILSGVDINQDSSTFNVADLSNEPAFLYKYLKIYKTADAERSALSQSINQLDFQSNDTKSNYESSSNYYVRISIKNDSPDSSNLLLNFSPNNWNQSWGHIKVQGYRNDEMIFNVKTGYNYIPTDKPVHSVMNLLSLQMRPYDQLEIIAYLDGVTNSDANTPKYIDFVLLKESQSVGLRADYPFKGEYILRKSQAAFRANHLVNHEIYKDRSASKSIEEIDEYWESLETSDVFNTVPDVDAVYWLRTKLIGTPQFNGRHIFQVSNAPNWAEGYYMPAVDIFSYNYVYGYYKNSNGAFTHQRVGDHVKAQDRPLQFWANFLTVDVPLGDTINYYVRLEGGDRRFPIASIVMYHLDPLSIFPKQVNQGWIHGLYYGALGVYLLFFSLLFVVEKEGLYLYFSIAILGLLMMNIFPEDIFVRYVVFPTWRDCHVPLYFLGVFAESFGFLKFTEKYFLIDKSSILSRLIIPGLITVLGFAALYAAIKFEYLPITGNPLFEPYMLTLLFLQLITILLPIVIAIIAKKKEAVSKMSYFICFVPLVIAGVYHFGNLFLPNFFSFEGFQTVAETDQSFNFIKLGVAAMLTLFAMNVGFRSNRLKADKKQALLLAEQSEIIEAKSKQNETLLKEIHHRVKNNLQTISSLLYLQSYGEKNEKTKENIAITQQRVESMALIHKNLYQRDNLAAIEMKEYIKNLCESLISAYQTPDKKVKLIMDMPILELDIDRAIPMGLIINEIVTNALKYAFSSVHEGELKISLKISEQQDHTLLIADNGMGKSEDAVSSFGSQLIQLLTKQINAKINSGNDNGHWISITWADGETIN